MKTFVLDAEIMATLEAELLGRIGEILSFVGEKSHSEIGDMMLKAIIDHDMEVVKYLASLQRIQFIDQTDLGSEEIN